jgi:diguanylate cyclase (GGDEF)-like protein/PAS domain S-box-containing protein
VPDIQQLLASAHYNGNALAYASAFTAVAILVLGIVVLLRGRGSAAGALFFATTAAAAGWLIGFSLMYSSVSAETALFWARVGHFMAALVPAATFHFAAVCVGRGRALRKYVMTFWAACAASGFVALFTSAVIPSVRRYVWGFYPRGTLAGAAISIVFAAIMFASIRIFLRAYRGAHGKAKERAGALTLSFVLASLGLVDFLPAVGIDIYPVGYMAILAFAIVSATAIWRFHLVDLTPEYAAGQILETMKSAVVVADMEGKIRVVNRAAASLLVYDAAKLQGMHIRHVLQPDENLTTGQLLNSMGILEQTMVWRTSEGARIDVLAASSFVRDRDGIPVGVIYVASDYTERKRVEQAIRESEHRFRTLFDANPVPMWVYDPETLRFTAVNDAAVRHYGYLRDEFLRMKITDIRPEEDVAAMIELIPKLSERRGPVVFRHTKKDGTVFDVEITSFEFLSAGRRARHVIAQDVTERRLAERALRDSEEKLRELFENANDIVYTHDLQGNYTSMNYAGERITGYNHDEVLSMKMSDVIVPEQLEQARDAFVRKLGGDESSTFYELDILAKDGRHIPVEVSTRLIFREGKPVGVQGIARDISERRENEARYRLLFERNLAGVYRTTVDGRILDCNDACARIFGYANREEFLSQPAGSVYFDREDRQRVLDALRELRSLSNLELRMRRRDGSVVWVLENVSLLESHEGDVMEGTLIDITERKTAHEQMEYQAYHDVLTGLPNRLLFRDRIGVALAHARRSARAAAVMFLDLDQFKLVNDTLGHTAGDRLLQAIGARLVDCVRGGDTIARMGGDEFTILLADIVDRRGAATVAAKVLEAVRAPVVIDEHELYVTTSIGIAVFPEDGTDAETLLKNADRAMYRAKELGRNNFQYATPATFDVATGRLSLERSLHRALEREEFVVHYQPMVEIATGRVVGAEALVRWNHPERGLVYPDDFIPVAEECQLIVPLGEWVLRTSCRQMKQWHDAGHHRLRVAVNLSPRQFQQRDLASMIERVLAETGFPATFLDLEITESTAMQNADLSLSIMHRLKEMGIRISIDDFGTGYSSLSYLKRFPIDTVKIDHDFVRDLAVSTSDGAIISAVISMARALKLRVVAEGVETQEQLAFLQREQCGEMQGFLFAGPLDAEAFEARLHVAAQPLLGPMQQRLRPLA